MVQVLNLPIASSVSFRFHLLQFFLNFESLRGRLFNHLWLGRVNQELHPANLILIINTVNTHNLEFLPMRILLNCAILLFEESYKINVSIFLVYSTVTLLRLTAKLSRKGKIELWLLLSLLNSMICLLSRLLWVATTSICSIILNCLFGLSKVNLLNYFLFAIQEVIFMKNKAAILNVQSLEIVLVLFFRYIINVSVEAIFAIFFRCYEMPFEEV